MYPMDFEEFCFAPGEDQMVACILHCFAQRKPLEEGLHHRAMLLFKQYMLAGGMPEAVEKYPDGNRSFAAADREKRDILSLYRDDTGRIDRTYRAGTLSVFDQIPAFLSGHEKRVRLSDVRDGPTYPMYEDTFFRLGDSMMVNACFNCADPNAGLSRNEERSSVKRYMGDTGLLVSHAFDENETEKEELYKQILHDRLSVKEGMPFENAVAQCLVAAGHRLFFYTHYSAEKHRNDMEIDFLLSDHRKTKPELYPVGVKSGKRYTVNSLRAFLSKHHHRIGQAYIIHTKNLCVQEEILCVPSYMAIFL